MFLEDISINYLAVILAAVAYFILGAIWYSPQLFGSVWLKHNPGISAENRANMIAGFVGEAVIGLIIAYIMAIFIRVSQADVTVKGIVVALWIWLGFVATTHFSAVLWGRKTLINFFIHAGFLLAAFILMGAIISGLY